MTLVLKKEGDCVRVCHTHSLFHLGRKEQNLRWIESAFRGTASCLSAGEPQKKCQSNSYSTPELFLS
uniref:Uncharacterized protein n=1 Tax=Anguilla anguilla TaxID=7936 RepID=A0A0E9W3F0_ANGAN